MNLKGKHSRKPNSMPFLVFRWGSFAVQSGIICDPVWASSVSGLGIISGRGSFSALYTITMSSNEETFNWHWFSLLIHLKICCLWCARSVMACVKIFTFFLLQITFVLIFLCIFLFTRRFSQIVMVRPTKNETRLVYFYKPRRLAKEPVNWTSTTSLSSTKTY